MHSSIWKVQIHIWTNSPIAHLGWVVDEDSDSGSCRKQVMTEMSLENFCTRMSLWLPLWVVLLQMGRRFQSHLNIHCRETGFKDKATTQGLPFKHTWQPTLPTQSGGGGEVGRMLWSSLSNWFSQFLFFVISGTRSYNSPLSLFLPGPGPWRKGIPFPHLNQDLGI